MMTEIEKQTMNAIISINRKSKNANQIDWEQRLYETAKDITCAYCISVGVGNSYENTEKAEIIDASVEMAKMLISKLKTMQKI
jgi:hypothetical protein